LLKMFDVKNKRAVITGGAQGFGKEFGIRLAGAGCRVCLADLDVVKGEEAKKEIQKLFNLKDDRFWRYLNVSHFQSAKRGILGL